MPFSFSIEKPANFNAAFEKLRTLLKSGGGVIDGDANAGKMSISGVEGYYAVVSNRIEITVNKKPAILPKSTVERIIKESFKKAGG